MIAAKIIADSQDVEGSTRLTTFELTYPRFIHSEFMTHRCFSRNAASSRAIPVEKMYASVQSEPAKPIRWGKNQKGMQDGGELDKATAAVADQVWLYARERAAGFACELSSMGVHKQIANRLIEPFSHITVIATSEMQGLMNLFNQRLHPAAMPEFQELARRMAEAWVESKPRVLIEKPRYSGFDNLDWHIPYDRPDSPWTIQDRLAASSGKCARVSYLTREEKTFAEDVDLSNRLIRSGHWSPFEHCAALLSDGLGGSNFGPNWLQYRHTFKEQCVKWGGVAEAVEAVKGRLGGKI